MKSLLRTAISTSIALGVSLAALPAFAQNTDGAFQLGLSAPILRYQSGTLEAEAGPIEFDIDASRTQIGIERNVMVELGYGLTDMFVLGGFIQLAHQNETLEPEDQDEQETNETTILIGPKFDAMFSPGEKLRPFVGGSLAFVSTSEETEGVETSLSGVQIEARGGLRWFPTPGFSLDPALVLGISPMSGETEVDPVDVDLSGTLLHVGINVGFSGWIL